MAKRTSGEPRALTIVKVQVNFMEEIVLKFPGPVPSVEQIEELALDFAADQFEERAEVYIRARSDNGPLLGKI